MRVTVVVVGDAGRSPRMSYHALSLAEHSCLVDVVAYAQTPLDPRLAQHANVRLVALRAPPAALSHLPWGALTLACRFLWISVVLCWALMFRNGLPHAMLVQPPNPPGLPALAVAWLCCRLKRARLIVDWHNFTATVLREQLQAAAMDQQSTPTGSNHPHASSHANNPSSSKKHLGNKRDWSKHRLVRLAASFERQFGRRSDLNLCVTHSMRDYLLKNDSIRAITLYDRPPKWKFKRLSTDDKHRFLWKMALDSLYGPFRDPDGTAEDANECTRFSWRDPQADGKARLRADRPALLVSSTSWTVDEDFGILLDALRRYDQEAAVDALHLPRLVCAITGKGPLKEHYLSRIGKLNLQRVEIVTPWLEHQPPVS